MTNKAKQALWMPKHDADFILEPVAKALLEGGVPKEKTADALTEAVKRVLRLAVSDADITVVHSELDGDARQVAERLMASVAKAKEAA
jgi:hypothetical protein